MKALKYIIGIVVLIFSGCEDVLDKEPLDMISDPVVWSDESLVEAYLGDLYYETDFVNLTGQSGYNQGLIAGMGAEVRAFGGWQEPSKYALKILDETGVPSQLDYWKYDNIRAVNYLIEQIATTDFAADYILQKTSEARFLRAYMYFEMVKRFGGVPIITEVQAVDASKEELYVSRNTEKQVYDFIASECDDLIQVLPESYPNGYGRPTKWAAYALKSRAMLYAASIAKYGEVQLNGIVGIPSNEVESYAKKSYDASLAIITSGFHTLYREHDDPMVNFSQIFLDESSANTERIFSERFDYTLGLGHSLAYLAMPDGFAEGWGSNFNFFLDHVELFEFADGSPGNSITREQSENQEWKIDELFGNRDPRFKATVFYQQSPWGGSEVYFHSATIVNGEKITSGFIGDDNWPAASNRRNRIRTGFHLRKKLNEENIKGLKDSQDNSDYHVFRMGEIYLNLAEAAFYLDKPGEALDAINEIRDRAGMPPKTEITEDIIHNERAVELTFEDHRYFDLRRWRIAVDVLDGLRTAGVQYTYNYDTKKYQIKLTNAEGQARVFQPRNYYYALGIKRLADNPSLVENPGY